MSDVIKEMELFRDKVKEIRKLDIIRVLEKASISEPVEEIKLIYEMFMYQVEIKKGLFIKIIFDLTKISDLYHTKLEFTDENYGFDKYSINMYECVNKDIVKCALELHEAILSILNRKGNNE